jgi:hypothetical protein
MINIINAWDKSQIFKIFKTFNNLTLKVLTSYRPHIILVLMTVIITNKHGADGTPDGKTWGITNENG